MIRHRSRSFLMTLAVAVVTSLAASASAVEYTAGPRWKVAPQHFAQAIPASAPVMESLKISPVLASPSLAVMALRTGPMNPRGLNPISRRPREKPRLWACPDR